MSSKVVAELKSAVILDNNLWRVLLAPSNLTSVIRQGLSKFISSSAGERVGESTVVGGGVVGLDVSLDSILDVITKIPLMMKVLIVVYLDDC